MTMMPAFPPTSGPAANSSKSWQCHKCGCCNTKNPNCCLSGQAWKVSIAPIIALSACMRELNGGVNGVVVIIKLHKKKLLFSLFNPQYNVVLPCWPSLCPSPAVSTMHHPFCRRSAGNTAVAPFPPLYLPPKRPCKHVMGPIKLHRCHYLHDPPCNLHHHPLGMVHAWVGH